MWELSSTSLFSLLSLFDIVPSRCFFVQQKGQETLISWFCVYSDSLYLLTYLLPGQIFDVQINYRYVHLIDLFEPRRDLRLSLKVWYYRKQKWHQELPGLLVSPGAAICSKLVLLTISIQAHYRRHQFQSNLNNNFPLAHTLV